jgi:hypothetical protein
MLTPFVIHCLHCLGWLAAKGFGRIYPNRSFKPALPLPKAGTFYAEVVEIAATYSTH